MPTKRTGATRKSGSARKQKAAGSDWFTQSMGDANMAIVRANGGKRRSPRKK